MKNLDLIINDYNIYLELDECLTLINGPSGIGKTLIFNYIKNQLQNPNIICINMSTVSKKNLKELVDKCKNKIIVIDNADVILDDLSREYIAFDGSNQYIIFGKNVSGLWINENNYANLIRNDSLKKMYLDYPFKNINK